MRLQFDGLGKAVCGARPIFQALAGATQPVEDAGLGRTCLLRPAQPRYRFLVPARFVQHHPQQEQQLGILRVLRQEHAAECLRLVMTPGVMHFKRQLRDCPK